MLPGLNKQLVKLGGLVTIVLDVAAISLKVGKALKVIRVSVAVLAASEDIRLRANSMTATAFPSSCNNPLAQIQCSCRQLQCSH